MEHSVPSTPKQNSTLFRFTLLKFWQPAQGNPPNRSEASSLIDKCFAWLDAKNAGESAKQAKFRKLIVDAVHEYFPDWDGASLGIRFKRKKTKPDYEKPADNNTTENRSDTDSTESDDPNYEGDTSSGSTSGSGGRGDRTRGDGNSSSSGSSGEGDGDGQPSGKPADTTCDTCYGRGNRGPNGPLPHGQPCPECGGTEPARADSDCDNCNGHGGENGQPCDSCGGRQPAGKGEWTCPNCENQNSNEHSSCPECGAEKPKQEKPDQKPGDNSGSGDGTCPTGEGGSDGEGDDGQPSNKPEDDDLDPVLRELIARIKAGLRNFYLYGPAGTGKTTLAKLLGHVLSTRDFLGFQWPVTVLSCNAGTSPSEIRGFYFPERRHSIITQALSMPGILVFDEYTTLDPSVAAGSNALLANGEIETSMGNIKRHEHCVIIVTSNTLGTGADREYIGNNQLDAATLDRFVGGYMEVNYNLDYERKYDKQVVDFVWLLRKTVEGNGYRRVVSTRAIQACTALKKAGLEWKSKAVASWTSEERLTIPGWGETTEKKLFPKASY